MGSKKILERQESWGVLRYNIQKHEFSYSQTRAVKAGPYSSEPTVLNLVVSRKCNLKCIHCVAKDFDDIVDEDLVLSQELTSWLQSSPFMVMVLTGGEPLLPTAQKTTVQLIKKLKNIKGIMIDTNGTQFPTPELLNLLRDSGAMVRVSMDSTNPKEEIYLRKSLKKNKDIEMYYKKIEVINKLIESGINTAIQTVLWRINKQSKNEHNSIFHMISWLKENNIKDWYVQRLIPSNNFKKPPKRFTMPKEEYYSTVENLTKAAAAAGIKCHSKADLRHNSVFLLLGDGLLFTQGSKPGEKVELGNIYEGIDYFSRVSAPDHASRYYLVEKCKEKTKLK